MLLLLIQPLLLLAGGEVWERDLTNEMEIGPSTEGLESVNLSCSADAMSVEVELASPFSGVLYTRGSYRRPAPCFLDPPPPGTTHFSLRIPFDECLTRNKSNVYQNLLIIQHDDDLIMPGDSAFTLECDFSKNKDYVVSVSQGVTSKITLADADPATKKKKLKKPLPQVKSDTENVSFVAKNVKIPDEL